MRFIVTFYFRHADPLTRTVRASNTFDAIEKASAPIESMGLEYRAVIARRSEEKAKTTL